MYKICYCSFGLNAQQLGKIPKEKLAAFLRQYSNVLDEPDEIIDGFLNSLTDDEVIEHFESFESSLYGFGPFASVCEILQEEMKISLCYDEDEKTIFVPAMLPWNMKENDLKIRSKNDLQMLFQPFLDELGISNESLNDIYLEVTKDLYFNNLKITKLRRNFLMQNSSKSYECSKYLGTLVSWENSIWYVDNDDCNFKDESDETSLFLLPKEYADTDKNEELMRNGNPDIIGFWVYESLVKPVNN